MNMQKNPTKIFLQNALAMIFIDFGLLRNPYCKIHLLADIKIQYVLKFDNLRMTRCAKIIAGFMANVGNVFIKRLQRFFSTFYTFFLTFFFKFLSEHLLHLWFDADL